MKLTRIAMAVTVAAVAALLWRQRELSAARSELTALRAIVLEAPPAANAPAPAGQGQAGPKVGTKSATAVSYGGPADAGKKSRSPASQEFWDALESSFEKGDQPKVTAAKLSRAEQDDLLKDFLKAPWNGDQKLNAGMWVLSTGRKRNMLDIMDYSLQVCAQYPGLAERYLNTEQMKVDSGVTTFMAQPREFAAWMEKNGALLQKVSPGLHARMQKELDSSKPAAFVEALAGASEKQLNGLVQARFRPLQSPGDFSGYVRALQQIPDEAARSRAALSMAGYLSRNLSFNQLKECAAQAGLKPGMEQNFRSGAAQAHMGSDGAARMEWALEACRTPEDRASTIASVVAAWTPQGTNDVGEWIKRQPQGLERDAATAAFARQVLQKEPPTAVDWALTIQSAPARDAALQEISRKWMAADAAAAKVYLAAKGIAAP